MSAVMTAGLLESGILPGSGAEAMTTRLSGLEAPAAPVSIQRSGLLLLRLVIALSLSSMNGLESSPECLSVSTST